MEDAVSQLVAVLTGLGLPGVVIAVQGWFLYKLYERVQLLNDERVTLTREVVSALEGSTTAMRELTQSVLMRGNGNGR